MRSDFHCDWTSEWGHLTTTVTVRLKPDATFGEICLRASCLRGFRVFVVFASSRSSRRRGLRALRGFLYFFWIRAQVSRRETVRLKTREPAFESGSTVK